MSCSLNYGADSLFDPRYMGGLDGAKGYRFETFYILSRIPSWLALPDLECIQQEGWSDLELFFRSGTRQLVQIKDHPLRPGECISIVRAFSGHEAASSSTYERFCIASAGLTEKVNRLKRQLDRYRSLEQYTKGEREDVKNKIRTTLNSLGLTNHCDLIVHKLYFEADIASVRDPDYCRAAFIGSLISTYQISLATAEDIFARTVQLLDNGRGSPIRLSLFHNALKRKQLEHHGQSLRSFTLLTKDFVRPPEKEPTGSFFYTGAAPTWSDILNQRDIPRDIAVEIMSLVTDWSNGRLLVPILAEAGEGKSTLLKRLAVDLATDNKTVLYHNASAAIPDVKEVEQIAQLANTCIYLFFDEVSRIHNFRGVVESISEFSTDVVIMASSRPYECISLKEAYAANVHVGYRSDGHEYSLDGLSDHEIGLLVNRLIDAKVLELPRGASPSVAVEAIKQRTNRKFLVFVIELTKGRRVHNIVEDEIERVRRKGNATLSAYRYICLMASINSFITFPVLEALINSANVQLDLVDELTGLITVDDGRLHARHNRIGEIATDIFFANQDNERGNLLCKVISEAFNHEQNDLIQSISGISRSIPGSQKCKVVSHLIDQAYCFGEIDLIQEVIEGFLWDNDDTEMFLKFLAAKTPFLWNHLIFPCCPDLNWKQIEQSFDVTFYSSTWAATHSSETHGHNSFEKTLRWAQIYRLAAWHIRKETRFLIAVTNSIYTRLAHLYPDRTSEIFFEHAEFLRNSFREKDSISIYKRVLKKRPKYADAHAGIALSFYLTDEYEKALHHFRVATKLDPSSLFRVESGDLFAELIKRLAELEDYIEYRKGVIKERFKEGRHFQNLIAKIPTALIQFKPSQESESQDNALSVLDRRDFSDAAEQRELTELDRMLEYLPSLTEDSRRSIEKTFSESFGDLRSQLRRKVRLRKKRK